VNEKEDQNRRDYTFNYNSFRFFLTMTQINNFKVFVKEVKERHGDYSKAEWGTIEAEYQKLSVQDRFSHEKVLTKEDKKSISALDGEYLSYRTAGYLGHIIEITKDAIDNTIEYADGFIEGVKNALENDTTNE
jgi:hypothetical protein